MHISSTIPYGIGGNRKNSLPKVLANFPLLGGDIQQSKLKETMSPQAHARVVHENRFEIVGPTFSSCFYLGIAFFLGKLADFLLISNVL